jgi:hypothetical protein
LYYDIVFSSCNIDGSLVSRLGFSKIGVIPDSIAFLDLEKQGVGKERKVIASGPAGKLISAANMGVAAVYLKGMEADKKLMASLADNGVALCISLSDITENDGLRRSHTIFKAGRLLSSARKNGVDIAFVTLARSRSSMCSYMQIVELAKLIGAEESYARKSISEVNGRLVV